ncbi:serine/threonine protein kinase [Pleionea mediterranea]|uniref:Serine/threonine protein kinase n=1 Tax=Pleionea mediterranea TaxID=523701 RepID=A0A316F9X9_9GAMM|nr:serine/threonine-protein kinase [Pleionea mediterranea]PWK42829.1 serine/threonine protein kinase [Pleionea mediterranea]
MTKNHNNTNKDSGVENDRPVDDATVLSNAADHDESNVPDEAGSDGEQSSNAIKESQPQARLTQIGRHLKSQESQAGFEQAKRDADNALAEKKIILNNRFVLESTIGAGGMGAVYRAQDLRRVEARDTDPYVAIKVLKGDFKQHPDAFIALQREASRSSKLAHPNIVTVHDFDRDGETVFMTMQLLQGDDLDNLIKTHSKGLPKQQAFKIIDDVCRGLEFAHEKGIIHCDLKPANLFLAEDGAKVLDFGIARLALRTQDHFDAGKIGAFTPGYASLEMFNGDDPDQSDDVFATAIIVYELLSGKHPYNGQSAPVALATNMQPAPIDGLSKKEWRALSNALQIEKSRRTKTIKEFRQAFMGRSKRPLVYSVVGLSVAVLASLAYIFLFGNQQLERKIEENIASAETCLKDQNFSCVINNANVILNIDPQHQQANALLKNARQLQFEKKSRETINELMNQANQCFDSSNFNCVTEHTKAVLAIDANHQAANDLAQLATQQQQTISLNYTKAMQQATTCFDRNDFSCAIEQAERALALKQGDEQALSLKQSANYSIAQQKSALEKASGIVEDGRFCLKKFDYSCAIAKAESALEFVAEYPPAVKLKNEAQKAMDNAKKSISIE